MYRYDCPTVRLPVNGKIMTMDWIWEPASQDLSNLSLFAARPEPRHFIQVKSVVGVNSWIDIYTVKQCATQWQRAPIRSSTLGFDVRQSGFICTSHPMRGDYRAGRAIGANNAWHALLAWWCNKLSNIVRRGAEFEPIRDVRPQWYYR